LLNWALTFLMAAIVAALLGFGGVLLPISMAWIAKSFFVVFLMLFLVCLIAGTPRED
jgi:uncharacterized membrane protein YtjA (UPF0391 family)